MEYKKVTHEEPQKAQPRRAATKGARLWPTAQPQQPPCGKDFGIVPRVFFSPPAAAGGARARPTAHSRGSENHRDARRFSWKASIRSNACIGTMNRGKRPM